MSAPLIPPPASDTGAQPWPRQLQRWLDVNPVTKLDRTQKFITLPAFSINPTWRGYSDIVAVFTFEASNNFSLVDVNTYGNNNQTSGAAFLGNAIGAEAGGLLI